MTDAPRSPVAAPRRGRRPAGEDTRGLIEEAARSEFAEKGYDGTSLRSVARAAGVDPALVHHYFASKADLFAHAVVRMRIDPAEVVGTILDGPRESLGERMIRTFLWVWDEPEHQARLLALLRAAQTNESVAALVRAFVGAEIVGRVTAATGVSEAPLRGGLAASTVLGLATMRYLIRMPGVAEAGREELVRWLGPQMQRLLVDGD